jgi:hypothetical protein
MKTQVSEFYSCTEPTDGRDWYVVGSYKAVDIVALE